MPLFPFIIVAIVGYLLGSLPVGYLVAKAKGVNIFEHGSKSPGATNVKRVLGEKFGPEGKLLGNAVFVIDAIKGGVAAGWPKWTFPMVAEWRSPPSPGFLDLSFDTDNDVLIISTVGLVAALLGHSFSCFTKFRGGKGVATTAGGFLVLMPVPLLISAAAWVMSFYASRYVSLASILAAVALPAAAFFLGQPPLLLGLASVIAAFVILRHRANIVRLLNGTENRFVKKSEPPQSPPSA